MMKIIKILKLNLNALVKIVMKNIMKNIYILLFEEKSQNVKNMIMKLNLFVKTVLNKYVKNVKLMNIILIK